MSDSKTFRKIEETSIFSKGWRMRTGLALLMILMLSGQVLAAGGCEGFVPKNNLSILPEKNLNPEMTEAVFKSASERFEKFFGQKVEEWTGDELIVFKSWKSGTVNAFAEKENGKVMVTIYGGLARHPAITRDGFDAVLCHELGHHFGGYPKKMANKWSSVEGQADYYATTKCLRYYWEKEDNQTWVKTHDVSDYAKMKCALAYPASVNEQSLCARLSMASMSVAKMIQALDYESVDPDFSTPDPTVVVSTQMTHPNSQCRLDTLFNGSLCTVDKEVPFDDRDELAGSCHEKLGFELGNRPKCWFKVRL